jgi:hypothetical protein
VAVLVSLRAMEGRLYPRPTRHVAWLCDEMSTPLVIKLQHNGWSGGPCHRTDSRQLPTIA